MGFGGTKVGAEGEEERWWQKEGQKQRLEEGQASFVGFLTKTETLATTPGLFVPLPFQLILSSLKGVSLFLFGNDYLLGSPC